ncbi:ESX secretion-associated protein EspG [Nocardia pseudobrasiliensis]|uniref:ESAT-6 protein secretion system EspG family protein n=1 Tax=Nocardia pseudobrasiliensis TaxID=45979 RepID=A0A370HT08_9NOCA|nr:ESX secretion-associated protein EspG [Nocardia pseudobrasiliensis]RDI61662.1 ESAT-6 protein secretion system EspG family protein [Nocardia pseudobrasiliensis]
MTVLGAGRGPSMLEAVPLSLDEMQFLLEKLEIDEVPVVLDAMGRYDNVTDHDAAMAAAAESLTARELLVDGVVHRDLEDRLRALYRPHWVIALRWYIADRVNRFCLAKGDELEVVALRGPDSYVIDEAGHDLPGTVMAALGPADPLELHGMNVLTEELKPIFNDAGDAAATVERLTKVGKPARDAQALGSALVEIHSHASVVGVIYGDGTRDITDGMVSVYNTRGGRFIATTTRSEEDVLWTSLASGTPARLRTALKDLIDKLPLREDFTPKAGPA